jgi:hypothetical protein
MRVSQYSKSMEFPLSQIYISYLSENRLGLIHFDLNNLLIKHHSPNSMFP